MDRLVYEVQQALVLGKGKGKEGWEACWHEWLLVWVLPEGLDHLERLIFHLGITLW